ncbi:hypothetical protein FSP39_015452 [Pinctada imbricata]|uniref:Tyrosine-protein kinase ephrin type A/B receptor-like domain-containing protein n=1 Tax=Pinctada imbricata TaxID=66713 RepID=A0AA89C1K9_PINIB|nr:hypothetical protein FSP39_015452 [Pinctada imbricata]
MLISPPANQYLDNINVLRHHFEMETFLIFKPESKGIRDMINVSKSEYVAGQLQNSTIVSMNQFWAYGVIHQENHTNLMVAALGYGFNEQPHNVSEQIPGDQIDNDGDGLVDEDFCGFLVTRLDGKSFLFDIDLDGALNEDCKGCPMGEEINEYLQCSACEIGTYRNAVGIDKCFACPTNYTTFLDNADSPSLCVDACPEGYELNNNTNKCQACAIGFYKDVNSLDTTVDVDRRWWCQECPTGQTTFFEAAESQNDCLDNCGAGQQLSMDTPSQTCEDCDYGWYKPHSSSDVNITAEERWNCTQCPDGTTTVIKGSSTVDLCLQKCKCPCNLVGNPAKANLSVEQKAEILENHVKELKVDKKKLSSSIRKKISAPDNRPSSTAFGGLGILMITLAVAILVFFDATTLKNHFIMFYHNVKAIMGRE